jgi:NitT/TauT family transport system substrate-binding protein
MRIQHARRFSRRRFLEGVTLAGAAGVLGLHPRPVAAEPPPEKTRLRLNWSSSLCLAPEYMAEELLYAEGFTEVQYVKKEAGVTLHKAVASGEVDLTPNFVGPILLQLEAGDPIVTLAGLHIGCTELFGTEQVRTLRDLKGKTVVVRGLGMPEHIFLASMAAYVGLDPRTDIHWVFHPMAEAERLLAEGKIDAWMAGPPFAQQWRAQQLGHVVVNMSSDRPWSQYFCCLMTGNREFVRQHPVATKRALRAILKAADVCGREPERVARFLVDKGYTAHYDAALQAVQEIPYDKWREYDPEDSMRFYALRLHEIGILKSSPQKLIAQGTDWRFFNELKKEMKG